MSSVQKVLDTQRRSGFAFGVLVGSAVTALWVVLSISTGLIFHFHPLLIGAGTAWGLNRTLARRIDVTAVATSALVATALVSVGGVVITERGGALDPAWFIALETAAGVALGAAIPRRSNEPADGGQDSPDAQERNAT